VYIFGFGILLFILFYFLFQFDFEQTSSLSYKVEQFFVVIFVTFNSDKDLLVIICIFYKDFMDLFKLNTLAIAAKSKQNVAFKLFKLLGIFFTKLPFLGFQGCPGDDFCFAILWFLGLFSTFLGRWLLF